MIIIRILAGTVMVVLFGGAFIGVFIFVSVPIIAHMFDVAMAYWGR